MAKFLRLYNVDFNRLAVTLSAFPNKATGGEKVAFKAKKLLSGVICKLLNRG